jgi:hypothetical protein
MDRRANVVGKARQRQFTRPGAAADRRFRLSDEDAPPGSRQDDRGRQAIGARADDDGVAIDQSASRIDLIADAWIKSPKSSD